MSDSLPQQPAAPPSHSVDPGVDTLSGRRWSRADLISAGAVALLVAAVTWWLRTEIVSTDPWHYGRAAVNFPEHSWVPLGYTRYGMILPLVPLAKVIGSSPMLYWLPSLVSSATIGAAIYLLGRRWWGVIPAVVALLLTLTNWIVLVNLSRFYPDLPSMGLVLLALVLAVAARGRMLANDRRVLPLVLAIGFLLGWSFEARETALFAWPPVLAVLWVRGHVRRTALTVALPIVGWALVDIAVSALAYGDPLLKLHTFTRQDLSQTTNPADLEVMKNFVGLPRIEYLTMIPKLAIDRGVPGGVFFVVLGVLACAAIVVRNRAVRVTAAAFLISYVMFVGIAGFFIPGHPAGRLDVQRYWIQFVPWMALAVAGGVHVLLSRIGRQGGHPRLGLWTSTGAGLLLVFASAWPAAVAAKDSAALAPNGGAPLGSVSRAIARQSKDGHTVWTDWQTARVLAVHRRPLFGGYNQWTSKIASLSGPGKPQPGDLVLIVRSKPTSCGFCLDALADWPGAQRPLPSTWVKTFTSPGGAYTMYRVGP